MGHRTNPALMDTLALVMVCILFALRAALSFDAQCRVSPSAAGYRSPTRRPSIRATVTLRHRPAPSSPAVAASLSYGTTGKRRAPGVTGRLTQLLLDAQQLVVTCRRSPRQGAPIDLSSVDSHHQIGDGTVFGFTRTVAYNRRVAGPVGHGDGV